MTPARAGRTPWAARVSRLGRIPMISTAMANTRKVRALPTNSESSFHSIVPMSRMRLRPHDRQIDVLQRALLGQDGADAGAGRDQGGDHGLDIFGSLQFHPPLTVGR